MPRNDSQLNYDHFVSGIRRMIRGTRTCVNSTFRLSLTGVKSRVLIFDAYDSTTLIGTVCIGTFVIGTDLTETI